VISRLYLYIHSVVKLNGYVRDILTRHNVKVTSISPFPFIQIPETEHQEVPANVSECCLEPFMSQVLM
jgi:hypothetical protein